MDTFKGPCGACSQTIAEVFTNIHFKLKLFFKKSEECIPTNREKVNNSNNLQFMDECEMYMFNRAGQYKVYKFDDIVPKESFKPRDLIHFQNSNSKNPT